MWGGHANRNRLLPGLHEFMVVELKEEDYLQVIKKDFIEIKPVGMAVVNKVHTSNKKIS